MGEVGERVFRDDTEGVFHYRPVWGVVGRVCLLARLFSMWCGLVRCVLPEGAVKLFWRTRWLESWL